MLTSAQCLRRFGEPDPKTEGQYMTLWDVPSELEIGVLPKRIYCNKLLVEPLKQAFAALIKTGEVQYIRTWDGCFQVRNKRGLSSPSLHSWGLAVDIDQATNPMGKPPTLRAGIVRCFTDAGFDWGGTWRRPDGMHFQLAALPD